MGGLSQCFSGNFLGVAATTVSVIPLTWAGVKYSWDSYQILVPLLLGLAGLVIFFLYEFYRAEAPVVPKQVVNNRGGFFRSAPF